MRDKNLDRAFGDTPPAFTGRINQTLAQLEDKPRRIPRPAHGADRGGGAGAAVAALPTR